MENQELPRRQRPRRRRVPRDQPPMLATDDVDGIYLAAQRAGKECIELLECSGRTCRVIGTFCAKPNGTS
jgi:hypothetical protein